MNDLDQIKDIETLVKRYDELLPRHVGLILDGNRRWIRKQGIKDTLKGHMAGYKSLKKILKPLFKANVRYLSVYALSSENIAKRSTYELNSLYKLFLKGVKEVLKEPSIEEQDVRIEILGRIHELPEEIQLGIKKLNEATAHHKTRCVNICVNYDGQLEIVDAVKKIIQNKVNVDTISKEIVKKYLYTNNTPELDFIIRTGMEDGARISGFLLWDASYAEFKFRNEYWPEYNEDLLLEDLKSYIKRNRRKGA